MKNTCLIICSVFFVLNSSAINYYVSNAGNDNNNGKSVDKSWRSIAQVNVQKLLPGDTVFFKSGDVFVGEVVVKYSGKAKKPIVFTAYGSGQKPVITGTVAISNWQPYKDGIQVASTTNSVYNLYVDGNMQTNARFPNSGLLKMDGGFGNTIAFIDNDLTQKDGYWKGATIRFRTWDWEYRTSVVTDYSANKVTIKDSSTNNLSAGWGYYFDNKIEELDTINEWFFDKTNNQLYYKPAVTDVSKHTVEATFYEAGFTINEKVNYIAISNLNIQQFQNFGVWAKGANENIVITSNRLENINLTAINFNLASKNCLISNNQIRHINGRGISALEPANISIIENNISQIGNIPGYGISGVNGMIGIAIENVEKIKTATDPIAINNLIRGNIIDSTGYVGIRMDGAKSIMEQNIVSNTLIQLSDGAAIYCWAKDGKYYTYDNVIRNNIVFNITGNNIGTPSESNPIANGIYIDNNCYNMLIEGNTVFNSTGSGIHINSDAYDNLVKGNTVYNCQAAVSIAEWAKLNSTYGNRVENNILFATNKLQRCASLSNWLLPSTKKLGRFNDNTYINVTEPYVFSESYLTADKSVKVLNEYSFEGWKKNYGFDEQSKYIGTGHALAQYQRSAILYNETKAIKKIDVSTKGYFDLDGKSIKTLELMPSASIIVLYK